MVENAASMTGHKDLPERARQPAESLLELLSFDGEMVINRAYFSLRKRPPDEEGSSTILSSSKTECQNLQIVNAMCQSPEATDLKI